MKKILTIAALVGATSLSFGQGIVNFANGVSSSTHVATNSVLGGGATTGRISGAAGSYYFALFVAPNGTGVASPSLAGYTLVGSIGTNTSLGRFVGNELSNGTAVNGYNPGDSADFIVAGWSSNIGTSWNEARAWWNNGTPVATNPNDTTGWFGISATTHGTIVGGGSTPVPALFGPTAGSQILGFALNMYTVPEPGTMALAGLGAAAMMIFRRRK